MNISRRQSFWIILGVGYGTTTANFLLSRNRTSEPKFNIREIAVIEEVNKELGNKSTQEVVEMLEKICKRRNYPKMVEKEGFEEKFYNSLTALKTVFAGDMLNLTKEQSDIAIDSAHLITQMAYELPPRSTRLTDGNAKEWKDSAITRVLIGEIGSYIKRCKHNGESLYEYSSSLDAVASKFITYGLER